MAHDKSCACNNICCKVMHHIYPSNLYFFALVCSCISPKEPVAQSEPTTERKDTVVVQNRKKKSVNFIAFGWSCQFRTYIYVVLNCLSSPNPIFFLSFFLLSFKKLITYMQQRTSEFYKFVILNSYLTAFLFVVAGLITKPIYLFEFKNL